MTNHSRGSPPFTYRLTKREESRLRLQKAEDGLTPADEVGSGKPHGPEKQRLAEIIDRLNDLYGAEVRDDDKLHFANGIADRIERDEAVMAQVRNHSEDQVLWWVRKGEGVLVWQTS